MKANMNDPWNESDEVQESCENAFEDAFVDGKLDESRLPDSEQYLERLYSRLTALQKGHKDSKQDLVNSLAEAKEDCIARLITERRYLESEEEQELATNPVIKLVAPHLQALTSSELVHLLKADVLQEATTEQHNESNNKNDENTATEGDSAEEAVETAVEAIETTEEIEETPKPE